jgi:hypothetical protein
MSHERAGNRLTTASQKQRHLRLTAIWTASVGRKRLGRVVSGAFALFKREAIGLICTKAESTFPSSDRRLQATWASAAGRVASPTPKWPWIKTVL